MHIMPSKTASKCAKPPKMHKGTKSNVIFYYLCT